MRLGWRDGCRDGLRWAAAKVDEMAAQKTAKKELETVGLRADGTAVEMVGQSGL